MRLVCKTQPAVERPAASSPKCCEYANIDLTVIGLAVRHRRRQPQLRSMQFDHCGCCLTRTRKLCSWCPVHVTWSWCFGGSCEEPPVMSSFQTRRHSPKQQATIQNTVAAYASRVQNATSCWATSGQQPQVLWVCQHWSHGDRFGGSPS